MGMLGNLVSGAALAGILLGPAIWTDAGMLLNARLSTAGAVLARQGDDKSVLDRTVATARAAFAQRRSAAHLHR